METSYRVVLADDHVVVREGLARLLSERADLEIVGEAGNGVDLISVAKGAKPDLVITAISLPRLRGIEAIAELRQIDPKLKFIVLTMHSDEDHLDEAIAAGADGFLVKEDSSTELFEAIDTVLAGKSFVSPRFFHNVQHDWFVMHRGGKSSLDSEILTLREREIVKLIAEGNSSKEIASLLFLSPRTVEHHRSNIMGKLNLKNAAEVARFALQKGLVVLIAQVATGSIGGGLFTSGLSSWWLSGR
jgi:DNA-binding NarL/FixJ family response regulator